MTEKAMKRLQKISILFIVLCLMTGCGNGAYNAGIDALENGEYSKGAEEFREAIEKEKNVSDSYRGLGIALFELEDYDSASEALKEALGQGAKETATIYSLLGNCAMELEQYEDAITYYELAIGMEDVSDELLRELEYNTIAAYEYAGDIETAKEKIAVYIEKYPDDESAQKEADFLETR